MKLATESEQRTCNSIELGTAAISCPHKPLTLTDMPGVKFMPYATVVVPQKFSDRW